MIQYNTAYQTSNIRLAEKNLTAVLTEFSGQSGANFAFKVGISWYPLGRVFNVGTQHAREKRPYFEIPREVGRGNPSYRQYGFTHLFVLFETDLEHVVRQAERRFIALGQGINKPACKNSNPGGNGKLGGSGPWYVYLALR